MRIDLRTAGVLGLLGEGAEAQGPAAARCSPASAAPTCRFEGSTTDPLHFAGLKGQVQAPASSLGIVGDPLGITLPTTPPFKTRGTLVKDGGLWKAVFDDGEHRLEPARRRLHLRKRRKVPLLSGRLAGSRLVLADLGPGGRHRRPRPGSGEGEDAPRDRRRVIPDKKFDLPSLRAMDANVLIDIAMFDPGTDIIEPLRPARAHLLLADGVLTLADFEGRTAQGRLVGYLQLDGRGKEALWTADLRALGVDLAQWLRLKRSARRAALCLGQARRAGQGEGQGALDRGDPGQPRRRRSRLHMRDARRSRTSPSRRWASTSPRRSAC